MSLHPEVRDSSPLTLVHHPVLDSTLNFSIVFCPGQVKFGLGQVNLESYPPCKKNTHQKPLTSSPAVPYFYLKVHRCPTEQLSPTANRPWHIRTSPNLFLCNTFVVSFITEWHPYYCNYYHLSILDCDFLPDLIYSTRRGYRLGKLACPRVNDDQKINVGDQKLNSGRPHDYWILENFFYKTSFICSIFLLP